MKLKNSKLITATSTAYVLAKYLQEFCQRVGVENYLTSPIRLQHGSGTGGFVFSGVGKPHKRLSASGNNDCTKERFRTITDSLELTYRTIDKIKFRSASCLNLVERNKNDHRIEHTEEVIDLYYEFEKEYIIPNKSFTPNDLAVFVLERTLVCLIEQAEQKTGELRKLTYNPKVPFSKYSNTIFYEGKDVSNFTKGQLLKLTNQEHQNTIEYIKKYNFESIVKEKERDLINSRGNHSLPSMDIALKYHNDVFSLLKYYYHYQLAQLTDPNENKTYYNEQLAIKYKKWETQHK